MSKVVEWAGQLVCPMCKKTDIIKNGLIWIETTGDLKQRYRCKICGHQFVRHYKNPKRPTFNYTFEKKKLNYKKLYNELFKRHLRYTNIFAKCIKEIEEIVHLDIKNEYKVIIINSKVEECLNNPAFD